MGSPLQFIERSAKKLAVNVLYHVAPPSARRRALTTICQGELHGGLFERAIRKYENDRYCKLDGDEQYRFAQESWSGEAGSSWIEAKRKRYQQGNMELFLEKVRLPFEQMVTAFINGHPEYTHIIEIGTGHGQFLFDLDQLLHDGHRMTGIDLNQGAIEENRKRAETLGMSDRLHFTCAEACQWIKQQPKLHGSLIISVGTFMYFSREAILEFLCLAKRQGGMGAIAILEDVLSDQAMHEKSQFSGSFGFSHDYLQLFHEAGYVVHTSDTKQIGENSRGHKWLYAIATFS
jgi:SAM-dependent methyltransferase